MISFQDNFFFLLIHCFLLLFLLSLSVLFLLFLLSMLLISSSRWVRLHDPMSHDEDLAQQNLDCDTISVFEAEYMAASASMMGGGSPVRITSGSAASSSNSPARLSAPSPAVINFPHPSNVETHEAGPSPVRSDAWWGGDGTLSLVEFYSLGIRRSVLAYRRAQRHPSHRSWIISTGNMFTNTKLNTSRPEPRYLFILS